MIKYVVHRAKIASICAGATSVFFVNTSFSAPAMNGPSVSAFIGVNVSTNGNISSLAKNVLKDVEHVLPSQGMSSPSPTCPNAGFFGRIVNNLISVGRACGH